MTYMPYFVIWEAVRFIIFERLICVFRGLSPMPTPVHASVEDITSTPSPAVPAYQISSAFGVFFRISDMGYEPTLGGPASSLPSSSP